MTSMRGLVAYPMVLFYGSFGIMAIFSSRGTGQLAKVFTKIPCEVLQAYLLDHRFKKTTGTINVYLRYF
jgi:hypothetical protein